MNKILKRLLTGVLTLATAFSLCWGGVSHPNHLPRYLTGGHKLSGNSQLHIKKSLKTEDFSNIQGSVTKSVTVTFLF